MASMVLGRNRRNNALHTSRVRSRSVAGLTRRGTTRSNNNTMEQRTESKMTVTMRWACGQFDDLVEDDVECSESNLQLPRRRVSVEVESTNSSQLEPKRQKSDAEPVSKAASSVTDDMLSKEQGDAEASSDFGDFKVRTSEFEPEMVERVKKEIADAISSLWNDERPASIDRESMKYYLPPQDSSQEQKLSTRKTSSN